MDLQREQVLSEIKNQIVHNATCNYWASTVIKVLDNKSLLQYTIKIELHTWKNDNKMNSAEIKSFIEQIDYSSLGLGTDNELTVADKIYFIIASRYVARDIKVSISNNNSGITISYNLNKL